MTRTVRVLITEPNSMIIRDATVPLGVEAFNKLVHGYIEHVRLAQDGVGMYINEEGRLLGMSQNLVASMLFWTSRQLPAGHAHDIKGPAVIVGPPDEEGWDTDVPERVIELLANAPGVTVVKD